MNETAKPKKGAVRPPGRRDIINWALASAGAVSGWFIVLDFIFTEWDWYDPLEDFSVLLLGLFICMTLGLAVGAGQALALPRGVAAYRGRWFWQTSLTLGGAFFMVFLFDEVFNTPILDNADNYVRTVIPMTVLAVPLLWSQARLLRQMGAAIPWLWPIPNLLFLWVALIPDIEGPGITVALLVWGLACGGALVVMLDEDNVPPEKNNANKEPT
jgi:hypothetical protein